MLSYLIPCTKGSALGELLFVRDRDVRQALHRKVLREHHGDAETLVVDELGLRHGTVRVDIAVVNGYLHGFEIKSDADTLERLPSQIEIYSSVLDRATLVIGDKHLAKAKEMVPAWWGIRTAKSGPRGGIEFFVTLLCQQNPIINPVALAELLWRPEVIDILRELDTSEKLLRKPRAELYRCLASLVPLDELRGLVRRRLKARERWRGHLPPSSCADC